jgi:hypothetical protein
MLIFFSKKKIVMSNPYNVFFDNTTGRVVFQKNNSCNKRQENNINDRDFNNKINELCNITKIEDKKIKNQNIVNFDIKEHIKKELHKNNEIRNHEIRKINLEEINKKDELKRDNFQENDKKISLSKKEVFFGIKKTILSDFNHLNNSSYSNDFKIGLNKNINRNNNIFDTFYLFPNIAEINTKNETNFINEKRVEIFTNINNNNDKQYFPIDFVACGLNIPLKSEFTLYKKLVIKNIFWNIFQSIDINKYIKDELLCIVPQKNDFYYKSIKLQINFELHSQVNNNTLEKLKDKILPYRNFDIKNNTPANSCLYSSSFIEINSLNGSSFDKLEINLCNQLDIQCALLCVKISVPDDCISILKGNDKMDRAFYGTIPFSQFILNFDYNLI